MPRKPRFFRRHRLLSIGGVLALPVIGVSAYFLATGLGSGQGHFVTGSAPTFAFTVTLSNPHENPAGTALTPGSGEQDIDVAVSDTTGTVQQIDAGTVSLDHDGAGGVFDTVSSAYVDGCQASWYTASLSYGGSPMTFPFPVPTSGAGFTVVVTMPANAVTNQSACENLDPQVTVSLT